MKTFYNFSSLFTYSQLYILPLYTKTTKSKFYYLHFIYSLFRRGVRIIGKINTLEKGTSFLYFEFEKTFLKFFIVLQVLRGVTVVQETTLTGEMTNRMIFTTTKIASHIKTYGGWNGMMIIVILYIHIYVKFQKVIYQPFVTILPNALFFFICNEINDNNMLIRNEKS